ncbi:MAG TPA: transglutaminase-like cysteine peptidase [Bryobacteraceae bacterium]|nr:transglutaminase-like cysteine peptidase [Bryobacteraceae bacterium]
MYWRLSLPIYMIVAGVGSAASADARTPTPPDPHGLTSIVESAPTLAPFQHVRFCLRYPAECKPSSAAQRIELDVQTMQLLDRVNRDVNLSITPKVKAYNANLADGWTIGPDSGDCNDYAVTKRHNLISRGLPSAALRLSVIKTPSGIGHLVLVVATTNGDVVLDNLTSAIRPWQITEYRWLKIQSATDPRLWHEVKPPEIGPMASQSRMLRVADR